MLLREDKLETRVARGHRVLHRSVNSAASSCLPADGIVQLPRQLKVPALLLLGQLLVGIVTLLDLVAWVDTLCLVAYTISDGSITRKGNVVEGTLK